MTEGLYLAPTTVHRFTSGITASWKTPNNSNSFQLFVIFIRKTFQTKHLNHLPWDISFLIYQLSYRDILNV